MKKMIIKSIKDVLSEVEKLQSDDRCREYSLAITKLEEAVHWLEHRKSND
jgi:hypothetical protein